MNRQVSRGAVQTRTVGRRLSARRQPVYLLVALLIGLGLVGCKPVQPSRWEGAQATTEGRQVEPDAEVVKGGELNRFFPKVNDPFNLVFLQEKEGFAEASLQYQGEDVATLAISDTHNNPGARDKFQGSSRDIQGYPLVAVGNNGSALLVADRFQVQVRAKAADFEAADREEWLGEFDLAGLSRLDR